MLNKIANFILGFTAGVFSLPVMLIGWPIFVGWFVATEREETK